MQQVLFWIPIKNSWFPEGIPLYAYGAMLFLTFVIVVWFINRRAARTGYQIPRERVQDMAIVLFISGLAGARITYMIQFEVPAHKFFRIWEGGIVLYGGVIGGMLAFILFHRYVMRRFNVTLWQLADVVAPALAIGIALGRVGCLLNGCCYGNIAPASCPAIEFPLLTAPAREMIVERDGLQTIAGFLPKRDYANPADVRTVVDRIEPGSAASNAGLKENDKIVEFKIAGEWRLNGEVLIVSGPVDLVTRLNAELKDMATSGEVESATAGELTLKFVVDKPENFARAYQLARDTLAVKNRGVVRIDLFSDYLNNWPRGRNSVQFKVERDGQVIELPAFTPRGIGLHPTQIYEIISMVLLMLVVLAFYPFRRHDGQVWVLFMIGYACHRFLNEILRTEPVEGLKMTLSQNISVLMLLVAIGFEIYLRQTQKRI